MTRFLFVALCLISASASAEMITYRFDAVKDSGGTLGPEGSPVVGFFSYDTGLRRNFDAPEQATYVSPSPLTQADLHFQIHYQDHSLYTTTRPKLSVLNDYGQDNPNIVTSDMFILSSTHMVSPTISFPSAIYVQVIFRDSDFSIFDSTDIPAELPPIEAFESSVILNAGSVQFTSLTRINNGDLNGDGFVGIDDLDIVLGNWNQTFTLGDRLHGDPSGDGFVGLADLDLVLANWNVGTPPYAQPTTAPAVPEPGAVAFLAACGLISLKRTMIRA